MLTIQVIHRSDASSAIRSYCADQDLFWSSVTEFKEKIDARWRHFDFESHYWVVTAEARAQLVEYLRRMEAAYGAEVEVGYETDGERTIREGEERREAEQKEEQRQAAEDTAEERRRRNQQQRHSEVPKEQSHANRRRRTRRQKPEGEPISPFHRRMDAESAYAALYLTPDAPPEMVQAAWRALAKIHHPDVGGEAAAMARINDAYRFLQEALKQRVGAA